jgi:hypothetical protein
MELRKQFFLYSNKQMSYQEQNLKKSCMLANKFKVTWHMLFAIDCQLQI